MEIPQILGCHVFGDVTNPCAFWCAEEYLGTFHYLDIPRGEVVDRPHIDFFKSMDRCMNDNWTDIDFKKIVPYLLGTGTVEMVKGAGELQFSTRFEDHYWVGCPPRFLYEIGNLAKQKGHKGVRV